MLQHKTKKFLVGAGIRDIFRQDYSDYGSVRSKQIRLVGSGAAGADNISLSAFSWQPNDLAIVSAHKLDGAITPSLPTGWTNINSGAASSTGQRTGWRLLQSGDTSSGTWTNATRIIIVILRNTHQTTPIGGSSNNSAGASTTPNWTTFTLTDTDGRSWVILPGGHQNATDMVSINLTGTENLVPGNTGTLAQQCALHIVRRTASWGGATKTVSGTGTYRTPAIEVRAA